MALKPYLIAPFESGLQNNIEPWLTPEDAFQTLCNAYVWRGRVKKRFGYHYLSGEELTSRLRISLGNTDGAGNIAVVVPGSIFEVGQMFSIGTEIFTVNVTGTPAVMLDTGVATVKTYDTSTGALTITGAAVATEVFFYPAQPVMGLPQRETANTNLETTIAFDTQFAYQRILGAWGRLGAAIWTGSNSQFFWSTNYRGASPYETYLYTVNGVVADQINYLPIGTTTWTQIRPQLNSGAANRFLDTAKIIIPFQDRLLCLNTFETDGGVAENYYNRARWTQEGDPRDPATSWIDVVGSDGGFIDAPTAEAIVTAQFIKDRLIVYFERSTWELVFTGLKIQPFRWQQLNSELGVEGTFSIIGFDRGAVGVGNVGVHTCNGVNVERIDDKIPDEVFKIHNDNAGPDRVYGIRDFYNEMVYWSFPNHTGNPTFPNRILAWNYRNKSWAFFDDSFTCFGYFQKTEDIDWTELSNRYGEWQDIDIQWDEGILQSQFPDIVLGNQQGFTFTLATEKNSNEQSLYITDMTPGTTSITSINHNLQSGDYILIEDASGITSLNDKIVRVGGPVSADNFPIDLAFSGTYTGGGKVTRVSNIDIRSKQWNPGTHVGLQFRMPHIDFLLDKTSDGEVAVDYYTDSNINDSIQTQVGTGESLLGSNVLYTKAEENVFSQQSQVRIWHRYFLQAEGQFLQIQIFMTDAQMRNPDIAFSNFQLNALILYAEPEGRIIG